MWSLGLAMTLLAGSGCDGPDPDEVRDASILDTHLEAIDAPAGGVDLASDPVRLDFGDVGVGSTSAPLAVRLENRGTATSAAIFVALGGSAVAEFRIVSDACTGVRLDPGAGCEVRVELAPGEVGLRSATLTATAGEEVVRTTLSGTGLGDADLFVTPSPFDFGEVEVGDLRPHGFVITNPGRRASGGLALRIAGLDASQFAIGVDACSGLALPADESCSVEVRYAPDSSGSHNAALEVVASPGGVAAATLRGQASVAPNVLEPITYDFGTTRLGEPTPPQTFTLRNRGSSDTGPLTVAMVGTNPSEFVIDSTADSCSGAAVPSLGSCTIVLRFSPMAAGVRGATLRVTPASGAPVSATVFGTALSS